MRPRLDKWYLDFQSGSQFHYFYVVRLSLGSLRFVTVEWHLHREGLVRRSSSWSRERLSEGRGLRCRNASLRVGRREVHLALVTAEDSVSGVWSMATPPPPRPFRPLFRNQDGWCDWKVWGASASVTLAHEGKSLEGLGYVDFVRCALPFWHVPFRSLFWGRMASSSRRLVFFHLDTGSRTLASVLSASGWRRDVTVDVIRATPSALPAFVWRIGESPLTVQAERVLEDGPILSRERLGWAIPRSLADRLSAHGHEAKFWATCQIDGGEMAGPIEEVRWRVR